MVALFALVAGARHAHAQADSLNYYWNDSAGRWDKVGTTSPMPVDPTGAATAYPSVVSTSLEATHVLKASAGTLFSVYATNLTGGTSGYLLVFNAVAAPADGAVTPIACAPFSGGVAQIAYQGLPAASFSTGISVAVSSATTCFTKTTGVLTAFISGMVK